MARLTGFSPLVRKQIQDRAGRDGFTSRCEKCGWWISDNQIHHRRPRGAGGSRRLDTNLASNGVNLCPPCHDDIESNRSEASDKGWLISQHRKGITPREIPVEMHDGTYLLDDDGHKYSIPNTHRETA